MNIPKLKKDVKGLYFCEEKKTRKQVTLQKVRNVPQVHKKGLKNNAFTQFLKNDMIYP